MPGFKVVIGLKNGSCLQKEVAETDAPQWWSKKIGDVVSGDLLGYPGYEFKIAGGSDNCGFPMRWDVTGPNRKKIFAVEGLGMKKQGKGVKRRRTVCGNTVSERTGQINLAVVKEGPAPIEIPKKEEKKA